MISPPHVAALVGLLIAAAALPACAEPSMGAALAATTLNVSAHGEAQVAPDMASLSLGVETNAPTAAQAMRANAARMSQVVAAVETAGMAPGDLRTSTLSLAPQYVYEQNRPARLTGYQASNQLTVTVRDLKRLGAVADAVVAAGATNIGQISFGLANPLAAENTARLEAVKALEDKAALYAQAVGYRILRLVNLDEAAPYAPGPRPMALMAMRAESPPTTPVEAGEIKVRVEVSGVFELGR